MLAVSSCHVAAATKIMLHILEMQRHGQVNKSGKYKADKIVMHRLIDFYCMFYLFYRRSLVLTSSLLSVNHSVIHATRVWLPGSNFRLAHINRCLQDTHLHRMILECN